MWMGLQRQWALHPETQSWRSHAFHAGAHRQIYHCAKGQRLMVISHPSLASRAVTLSCWLSLALLTTKLPLCPPLPQSPPHSVPPSPFGKPWFNKAEECGGGGKELAGVSGSQWPRLKTKKSTCGSRAPWYVMLPLHGTRTPWERMHASTEATVCTDIGGGRALIDGGRALSRCPCLQSSR